MTQETTPEPTQEAAPSSDEALVALIASEAPEPIETGVHVAPSTDLGTEPQVTPEPSTQAPAPATDRASKRILANQRKEKELQLREQQLRLREQGGQPKQPQRQATQAQPRTISEQELKNLARRDPDALLRLAGVDARYVNEFYINGKQPSPETQFELLREDLGAEVMKTRAELAQFRADHQARLDADQDAQNQQIYLSTVGHILQQPDVAPRFEMVMTQLQDPAKAIQEVVREDFKQQLAQGIQQPRLMEPEEAAELLEAGLEEDAQKQLAALARSKKFQHLAPKAIGTKKIAKTMSHPGMSHSSAILTEEKLNEEELDQALLALLANENEPPKKTTSQGVERSKTQRVAITQGHMQQLPDRQRELTEDELDHLMIKMIQQGGA